MSDEPVEKRQYRRYEYYTAGPNQSVLQTGVVITAFEEPSAALLEQARQSWIAATRGPFNARFSHVSIVDLVELEQADVGPVKPLIFGARNGEVPS